MSSGTPAAPSPPPTTHHETPAPARTPPSDAPCATPLTNRRCDSRARFSQRSSQRRNQSINTDHQEYDAAAGAIRFRMRKWRSWRVVSYRFPSREMPGRCGTPLRARTWSGRGSSMPRSWFAGYPVELWIDNSGAMSALIKDYSGLPDCSRLVKICSISR